SWSAAASMSVTRTAPSAVLLPSGEVLVVGGNDQTTAAELYDPAKDRWSLTGNMSVPRTDQTATLLRNSKVLVTGGITQSGGNSSITATAELYDASTNSWTSAHAMSVPREQHTATLLRNGSVLVAGGNGTSDFMSSAEVYHP